MLGLVLGLVLEKLEFYGLACNPKKCYFGQKKEGAEKRKRVISYASANFTSIESNYHCNEQECLAVIWAIKRYRPYLEDSHFTIRTDSTALTWLRQVKDSRSKLVRWACLFDELSF